MLRPFQLLKVVKASYLATNKVKYFLKDTKHQVFSKRLCLIARENPVIMKLDSPEFKSIFTFELMTLASLFDNYNYQIRIAGGAVRDLLLGKKPKDIDFATTATPDQMKKMFQTENIRMINTKGETHGTITARINNKEQFEITTLRIDKVTDGRHASVEFTTDWKLDASRRDLTINSMFLGFDGTLYDYFNGYDDLLKRRIIFVGNATLRIQEDYLRILRYFRFYGRVAEKPDNHDQDVLDAIKRNVKGLDQISGERIWLELAKIVTGNFASELMITISECGIFPHIGIPQHANINSFQHRCVVTKDINVKPATRLSALCNTEEEWYNIVSRLKLSAFERNLGIFLLKHRNDLTISLKWCQRVTILNSNKGKGFDMQELIMELLRHQGSLSVLQEYQQWKVPKFPVNGYHLKELGVPMGKVTGRLIEKLKEYWLDNDLKPSSEEMLEQVPSMLDDMGYNFKPPPP